MYSIYYADMGKATGIEDMGKRPVVCIEISENKAKVYKITSRYKKGKYYARINNYIVNGFCCVSKYYTIDKKYLLNYKRDCTLSEIEAINKVIKK